MCRHCNYHHKTLKHHLFQCRVLNELRKKLHQESTNIENCLYGNRKQLVKTAKYHAKDRNIMFKKNKIPMSYISSLPFPRHCSLCLYVDNDLAKISIDPCFKIRNLCISCNVLLFFKAYWIHNFQCTFKSNKFHSKKLLVVLF